MTYVTKDSGVREEYDSGMRRDTQAGKPDFSLCLPLDVPYSDQMLTRWAALMTRGAEKYGARNWELASSGEEYERFKASAFRHFMQWYHGVDDGEDHAAAVFFNVTAAERIRPELRPLVKVDKECGFQEMSGGKFFRCCSCNLPVGHEGKHWTTAHGGGHLLHDI